MVKKGAPPPKRRPLKGYHGGVKPGKRYGSIRAPDDVIDTAKKLFFVLDENLLPAYTQSKIIALLKNMYPIDCANLKKPTFCKWITKLGWKKERDKAVEKAYSETKNMEDAQRLYNQIVLVEYRMKLEELADLNKPMEEQRKVLDGLNDEEQKLIHNVHDRLGLVLVELRSLNGIAFNQLSARDRITKKLLFPYTSRDQAFREYQETFRLLTNLFGIQLLNKLVSKNLSVGGSSSVGSDGNLDFGNLSEDMLRKLNFVLPDEFAAQMMKNISGGNFDVQSADGAERISKSGRGESSVKPGTVPESE